MRRALTAALSAAVLVAASACSQEPTAAPSADPTASGAAGGEASTAAPVAEADHVVEAPGPRGPGVLAPADVMVVLPDSATPEVTNAVEQVEGVSGVTVFALSETVIENQALTIAAVDPAAYRTFTPQTTADALDVWQRVAGGELAIKKRLQDRAPIDDQGYLRLGAATDAPAVHVGAYVDQQPLIDVVVNQTWVDTLEMVPDNAMLVRTGTTPPAKVLKKIEAVVGEGASVTAVDKATRLGLEPGSEQVAVVTGSVSDAVGVYRYTVLGGGRIAPDPAWVSTHISTEVVPILGAVTCNKLIFPQLKAAFQEIADRGLSDEINPEQYAGCYYPRFIAGSSTLSNHAFGLALDLNTATNGRGIPGDMDRGVVDIFKKWGFAWGGDWAYTDPMHFEMAQLVTPGGSTSARTN